MLRPIAVNTRRQAFDAVDVKIKVDDTCCSEIGEQRLFCAGEESRKLREGDALAPAPKVKSGTPATCCSEIGEQRLFCAGEESRKLREGDGLAPAPKVKSGTPPTNDIAEVAGFWGVCERTHHE